MFNIFTANNDVPTYEYVYIIVFAFIIVIAMTTMTLIASKNLTFSKKQRFHIGVVFITIAFIALADMGSNLIEVTKTIELRWLDYTFTYWTLCAIPYIPIALTNILHGSDMKKCKLCFTSIVLFDIYVIVLLILTATGYMFEINDDMVYTPYLAGKIFYLTVYGLSVLLLLVDSLFLFRKLLARKTISIFFLFLLLVVSSSLQLVFMNIRFTYLIISIISIIFYDYCAALKSQIDGLTGLFSHYAFVKYSPAIKMGDAIFVMDADNFKQVNDKYGHIKGDEVLKSIAKVIQQTFPKNSKSFRIGGDEFVTVISNPISCENYIDTFKAKINNLRITDEILPNVSIGYCIFDGMRTLFDFENIADKNMYIDKARNKAKNDSNEQKDKEEDK